MAGRSTVGLVAAAVLIIAGCTGGGDGSAYFFGRDGEDTVDPS